MIYMTRYTFVSMQMDFRTRYYDVGAVSGDFISMELASRYLKLYCIIKIDCGKKKFFFH